MIKMRREQILAQGERMTRNLGLESQAVKLFWKAFEENRLMSCWLLLKSRGYEVG